MSMYGDDDSYGGDLYEAPQQQQQPQPASTPVTTAQAPQPPTFAPVDAVNESLALLSGDPSGLLGEILPPNPADSKLPMGLAVLGACVFGIIWADSLMGGSKK